MHQIQNCKIYSSKSYSKQPTPAKRFTALILVQPNRLIYSLFPTLFNSLGEADSNSVTELEMWPHQTPTTGRVVTPAEVLMSPVCHRQMTINSSSKIQYQLL